ncbi:MAG: 3-hydroxyacyl-CoA dehydrogenase [Syntrophaceae bacterium]|nr:3-hydroxyacyl-CoA dehydrogenase [Syntrophaceae bacterium]
MKRSAKNTVSLVGVGVIGRGWMRVFSSAGYRTQIYDENRLQVQGAVAWLEESLFQDIRDGLISQKEAEKCLKLIYVHDDFHQALAGADYVQESGPERLELKQAIFDEMDRGSDSQAILASSTSGLDINAITEGIKGANRCIMAHPFNPPHVTPVVEILPTAKTAHAVTERTMNLLTEAGQKPVLLNCFIPGFLGNRLQAAVMREAIHLVEKGVAGVEAVDAVMSHGLGLRWAVLGVFGVNNTNADGGVREYYQRYGEAYIRWMNDLDPNPPSFSPEMIEMIAHGVEHMEGEATVQEICTWRDRLLRNILHLKEKDPHP